MRLERDAHVRCAGSDDADAAGDRGNSAAENRGARLDVVIEIVSGRAVERGEGGFFEMGQQQAFALFAGHGDDGIDLGRGLSGAEHRFGNADTLLAIPIHANFHGSAADEHRTAAIGADAGEAPALRRA